MFRKPGFARIHDAVVVAAKNCPTSRIPEDCLAVVGNGRVAGATANRASIFIHSFDLQEGHWNSHLRSGTHDASHP